MYSTPSPLSEEARHGITAALNASLADGLDLYSQIKVAHWNIKGPHFAALHPLFDTIAGKVLEWNDEIAERAVTLGALAEGTVRVSARASRVPDYPTDVTRDLEHVELLIARLDAYRDGLSSARDVADDADDQDTVDMLTGFVQETEKFGWFLRATLET